MAWRIEFFSKLTVYVVFPSPRPFHPVRLYQFFQSHFELQQPDWTDNGHEMVLCDDINCTRKHASRPTLQQQQQQRLGREDQPTAAPSLSASSPGASLAPSYSPKDPSVIEELSSSTATLIEKAQAFIRTLQMHRDRGSVTPEVAPTTTGSTSSTDAELMASVASLEGAASSAAALAASFLSLKRNVPNSGDIMPSASTSTSVQTSLQRQYSKQPSGGGMAPVTVTKGVAPQWGNKMRLLRSRGYAWVAGSDRSDHCCEWRQSGTLMTFGTGGPWYCVLPRYGSLIAERSHCDITVYEFYGSTMLLYFILICYAFPHGTCSVSLLNDDGFI